MIHMHADCHPATAEEHLLADGSIFSRNFVRFQHAEQPARSSVGRKRPNVHAAKAAVLPHAPPSAAALPAAGLQAATCCSSPRLTCHDAVPVEGDGRVAAVALSGPISLRCTSGAPKLTLVAGEPQLIAQMRGGSSCAAGAAGAATMGGTQEAVPAVR